MLNHKGNDMISRNTKYKEFQEKYLNDFSGFITDCIDWKDSSPADYQLEIANDVLKNKCYSVRSPRGAGKTTTCALTALAFALTRDGSDWQVVTHTSNWSQTKSYLWPEIHKWSIYLKWDMIGREPFSKEELLTHKLILNTGEIAVLRYNIDDYTSDELLYIFDEAKGIKEEVFSKAKDSCTLNKNHRIFSISTPGGLTTPGGVDTYFDKLHKHPEDYPEWVTQHITIEKVIKANRMT